MVGRKYKAEIIGLAFTCIVIYILTTNYKESFTK